MENSDTLSKKLDLKISLNVIITPICPPLRALQSRSGNRPFSRLLPSARLCGHSNRDQEISRFHIYSYLPALAGTPILIGKSAVFSLTTILPSAGVSYFKATLYGNKYVTFLRLPKNFLSKPPASRIFGKSLTAAVAQLDQSRDYIRKKFIVFYFQDHTPRLIGNIHIHRNSFQKFLMEKSTADIDEIEAVYDFLKSQKGPYWERLQADEWDIAFEKLKK